MYVHEIMYSFSVYRQLKQRRGTFATTYQSFVRMIVVILTQ